MSLVDKIILVIDDDEDLLILVKKIVEGAGATCITTTSVSSATLLALATPPHLVIVDLNMPGLDGFSFLERRQIVPQLAGVPIIVFSASKRRSAITRAYELGAADFVKKPLKSSQFLQILRKCLFDVNEDLYYEFKDKPKLTVQIPGELIFINEEAMSFASPIKLDKGRTVQIESAFLDECRVLSHIFNVDVRSIVTSDHGQYVTKVKFIGLSDDARKMLIHKIRNWK